MHRAWSFCLGLEPVGHDLAAAGHTWKNRTVEKEGAPLAVANTACICSRVHGWFPPRHPRSSPNREPLQKSPLSLLTLAAPLVDEKLVALLAAALEAAHCVAADVVTAPIV